MRGWPDPTRPGVPMEPEKDGWHWLEAAQDRAPIGHREVMFWFAGSGFYSVNSVPVSHARIVSGWLYLGPCLTPAEVAAREAAARAEGRREGMREAVSAIKANRFKCEFFPAGRSRNVPMLSPGDFKDQAEAAIRAVAEREP